MSHDMTLEEYLESEHRKHTQNRIRGRRNKKKGDRSERRVKSLLIHMGLRMVEKVEVPWKVIRNQRGKITKAFPADERVSGDFRAATPDGQSVLVEVKARDGRLPHSALEEHQRRALDKHHATNGLSLLVWVHDGETDVMEWPIDGFVKYTSINPEQAKENAWRPTWPQGVIDGG